MKIYSVFAKNFGPFAILEKTRLGSLATIIGQNDAGKSNILKTLQVFLQNKKIEPKDVYDKASSNEDVLIELSFESLPDNIEIEEGVATTLQEEMLLDEKGHLCICKAYRRRNLAKFDPILITYDFEDNSFSGLACLKEDELNERCLSLGIEVTRSGRGITNKSKREALRAKAKAENKRFISKELPLDVKSDLWKIIESLLPEFMLFETDTELGVGEMGFQNQFKPVVKTAIEHPDVLKIKDTFANAIGTALQNELDDIYQRFKKHTNAFVGLTAKPLLSWDKAFGFDILGKDKYGVENSLDQRGSGVRRLLMVAFFQYLAYRGKEKGGYFVFAVEEPENCLHPGLQRELISSFRQLADEGYQIISTSHSPVFAGASPIEDLALVVRVDGIAKAIQLPDLNISSIAEELGVEPADQITGYRACIFVEGPDDIEFWQIIASKLKKDGYIKLDFQDKQIGFIIAGGENLKHWVNLRAMNRLSRRFGVVVDSDRKSSSHSVPGRKINWKNSCEKAGGLFFILRKREIENYLHKRAIENSGRALKKYDDFSDMKSLFGENVYKVIKDMTCKEILEMDYYKEGEKEHHELKEIIEAFLSLADY